MTILEAAKIKAEETQSVDKGCEALDKQISDLKLEETAQ